MRHYHFCISRTCVFGAFAAASVFGFILRAMAIARHHQITNSAPLSDSIIVDLQKAQLDGASRVVHELSRAFAQGTPGIPFQPFSPSQ
jgi:hypothetical protein